MISLHPGCVETRPGLVETRPGPVETRWDPSRSVRPVQIPSGSDVPVGSGNPLTSHVGLGSVTSHVNVVFTNAPAFARGNCSFLEKLARAGEFGDDGLLEVFKPVGEFWPKVSIPFDSVVLI